jgi:DNA-binding NtrC family response regulator
MDTKGRILVVDDEEIVRISCRRILTPLGYTVETTPDGLQALELMKENKYDLILTDLKMPHMDGMEVMAEIRKREPDAKVIIVTGYSTIEVAVKAIKMGAYNYIEKPFSPEVLISAVKEALGESG